MWILIIIIVAIAVCAAVIYHDTHNFVIREYEVKTGKVDRDYTFVLLTDLHGYVFGNNNDKLIEAVRNINPDAVLCAGDMFTARPKNGKIQTEAGFNVLSTLAGDYSVYASNGNHEEKIKHLTQKLGNFFIRYKSQLERAGVHYLENESAYFDQGRIRITGLELSNDYFQKLVKKKMEPGFLQKKIGAVPSSDKDKLQILIAHNPQYFEEYANWGADITVSGHVHGGIVRIPFLGGVISPAIALFPKYDGGKYEKNGHTMILGRGLGTHTIHIRLFNPCELAVIRVRGE